MMTKQIVPKRTQAILSLSDGLQVQNHELVQSEAFTEFLALQNSLQQQIDERLDRAAAAHGSARRQED